MFPAALSAPPLCATVRLSQVRRRRRTGRCPTCGRVSRSVPGQHLRHPADLPAQGVRRAMGADGAPLLLSRSGLSAPPVRRTDAELGSRPGQAYTAPGAGPSRHRLRYKRQRRCPTGACARQAERPVISRAYDACRSRAGTGCLTRHRRGRLGLATRPVVGDDHRQPGTHRPVALLPDSDLATQKGWLGVQSGIEDVTRDRSTGYARASRATPSRQGRSASIR